MVGHVDEFLQFLRADAERIDGITDDEIFRIPNFFSSLATDIRMFGPSLPPVQPKLPPRPSLATNRLSEALLP